MSRLTRVFSDAASNLLFHWAEIADVIDHGDCFRSIRLRGTELQGPTWTPGDKVQIRMDGVSTRTYTPTSWDSKAGTTSLLAYLHSTPGAVADGPGDAWVRNARAGGRCQIFGPRKSLRLEDFDAPPVMVGDETSFALSLAWRALHGGQAPAAEIFEVTDVEAANRVLGDRGFEGVRLVQVLPEGAHLEELAHAVAFAARSASGLCLTGKAQTIASIRTYLNQERIEVATTRAKAYWDERRIGLD